MRAGPRLLIYISGAEGTETLPPASLRSFTFPDLWATAEAARLKTRDLAVNSPSNLQPETFYQISGHFRLSPRLLDHFIRFGITGRGGDIWAKAASTPG